MKVLIHLFLVFWVIAGLCRADEKIDRTVGDIYFQEVPAEVDGPPDWWKEAYATRDERLGWWEDARFGCFVHWGVYSVLAGYWKGEKIPGYSEHIQRKCRIPQDVYRKEVVEKFNPMQFNADEWIRLIHAAGMRYFVITAKHHDGFAMYDSDVSDWNVVDATPFGRDPMKELKAACDKYGVKFGFYFSHAFDWGHPNAPGNDWEWGNPGGDKQLGGQAWWKDPVMGKELPRIYNEYVLKSAIPQILELVEKYDPVMIWFDTPHKLPNSINYEIMHALRKASPNIVINGRMIYGRGDYTTTCDMPVVYPPVSDRYWEGVPTTNRSYGWSKHDKEYKSPAMLIRLLISAVARGGNMLLNIGPTDLGTIDAPDVKILEGFAAWMKQNADTIHGCGRTVLPVQSWGESTRKNNTLFLQVYHWPTNGVLEVGSLFVDPVSATLHDGSKVELSFKRLNERTLQVQIPTEPLNEISSVIALQFKEGALDAGKTDVRRLLAVKQENFLGTFDAELSGSVAYASGSDWRDEDGLKNWIGQDDTVIWPLYLNAPGKYTVRIGYYGNYKNNATNRYQLVAGEQVVQGVVQRGKKQDIFEDVVGRFEFPAGNVDLILQAASPFEDELFRPRWVKLSPVD